MLAALVLVLGAIIGRYVIHKFATYATLSKTGEAKRELKRLCIAQIANVIESDAGTAKFEELQVEIAQSRYSYFLAPGAAPHPATVGISQTSKAPTESALPPKFTGGLSLGMNGACPECSWVMAAAGNIDGDPALDIWSVSTLPRTGSHGEKIERCVAVHEQDDIDPVW